ncbi:MAG: transcriptional repressor LexA [Planctomycetota bacterium]
MRGVTPRQLRILNYVREFTERRGYSPTLDEIADSLGVTKPTVQQYLRALERKGAIVRERYAHRSIEIVEEERRDRKGAELPFVGRIAAGEPIEAVETIEAMDVRGLLGLKGGGGNHFVLQVKGDSMIGEGIFDGDYVVVERRETAESGEAVVALLPDNTATLKRLYKEKGRLRLQPANPAMEPIYADEVTIQGVVKGVLRAFK